MKRKLLSFSALVIFFLFFAINLGHSGSPLQDSLTENKTTDETTIGEKVAVEALFAGGDYSDIQDEIGKVEEYNVSDPKGTAILIPQTHQYPGSKSSDPVNDSAEVAQEQISEIIKYMSENSNVQFAMVEGALAGQIPQEKISLMSEKLEAYNNLETKISALKEEMENGNTDPKIIASFAKDSDAILNLIRRDLILMGGAYMAKAEGADISLFGTEKADTLDQCAEIVRNQIYLRDRKKQLSEGNNGDIIALLRRFQQFSPVQANQQDSTKQKFQYDLSEIKNNCDGEDGIKTSVDEVVQAFNSLISIKEPGSSQSASPSRDSNPYASVNSISRINNMLQTTEGQIEEVVVKQRNRETAQEFAKIMQSENFRTGLIQFGAGHKEGLVKELNAQGVSVIVVTPKEVLK
jgi:hypothetical protein